MIRQDCIRSRSKKFFVVLASLATVLLPAVVPMALSNNECDVPGETPDVITGDLYQTRRWGSVGDITAFSVGTWSCNIGTCWAVWFSYNNQHPVIAQNMFRLMDGKFEQIGQSWLKHGFYALSSELCTTGCQTTNGDHLGVDCADPYSAGLNGAQDRLGPKFEVNPFTGDFPYPATDLDLVGDAIYKRLQVHNDDLDPVLNPGAEYFVESQYVTPDEQAGDTQHNNAAYAPIDVFGSNGNYDISLTGPTERELPGIMAWVASDPEVDLTVIQVPNDGYLFLAAKATDLGGGMWNYEYAIQNMNSNRAVWSFSLPMVAATNLTNVGFHDVDYHSGEPFDGTDWPSIVDVSTVPARLLWKTKSYFVEPNANALRWDTLYNFRFDAPMPPRSSQVELGLFLPGFPNQVQAVTTVPALCNFNGACDVGEDLCYCDDCEAPVAELNCTNGVDDDCDGHMDCYDVDCCVGSDCDTFDPDDDGVSVCEDCQEREPRIWSTPGEVRDVEWRDVFGGQIGLGWTAPEESGTTHDLTYETLRALQADDFMTDPACLASGDPRQTWQLDPEPPPAGSMFCYLVRAMNQCPGDLGEGGVGTDSNDEPRSAASCP
jgi:hypothetical protein